MFSTLLASFRRRRSDRVEFFGAPELGDPTPARVEGPIRLVAGVGMLLPKP